MVTPTVNESYLFSLSARGLHIREAISVKEFLPPLLEKVPQGTFSDPSPTANLICSLLADKYGIGCILLACLYCSWHPCEPHIYIAVVMSISLLVDYAMHVLLRYLMPEAARNGPLRCFEPWALQFYCWNLYISWDFAHEY
jgi:hypothetical protein